MGPFWSYGRSGLGKFSLICMTFGESLCKTLNLMFP